jgi:hypothetical protein
MGQISQILGIAGLVAATAGLLFVNTWSPQNLCQRIFPLAALSPILAVAAMVLGGIARQNRPGRVGLWTGGSSLGVFLLFWMQMGYPPCGERFLTNRQSAISSLRTINTAEITYASTYNQGYSPDLASLGPPSDTPSASGAGLIDEVLARSRKSGYIFKYTPGRRDAQGRIVAYTVVARPIKRDSDEPTSGTSFFTDESGSIRYTDEQRVPAAQDPPIGQ